MSIEKYLTIKKLFRETIELADNNDSAAALNRARTTAEKICENIIFIKDIDFHDQKSFLNYIQLLDKEKLIDKKYLGILDIIRTYGNKGTHQGNNEILQIELTKCIEALSTLVEWHFKELNKSIEVEKNPYLGFEEFTDKEEHLFYGRTKDIDNVINSIGGCSCVAITGPSGVGKSSFIKAGLIPQLKKDGWIPVIFRPGRNPFNNLVDALIKGGFYHDKKNLQKKYPDLAKNIENVEEFFRFFELISISDIETDQYRKILLVINQCEELFIQCKDKNLRETFIKAISEHLPDKVGVLFTLRNDFIQQATVIDSIKGQAWITRYYTLKPMNEEQLKSVIIEPAKSNDYSFEDGLVDRILTDMKNSPGILPLLEYCLSQLWKKRQRNILTHAAYEEMDGLHGCLVTHADAAYKSFDPSKQQKVLNILRHLVTVSEKKANAKNKIEINELCNLENMEALEVEKLLLPFNNKRLIIYDGQSDKKTIWVEFAHEAVFRYWEPLKQLLIKQKNSLIFRQDLRARAISWQEDGENQAKLLPDDLLFQAQNLIKNESKQVLKLDDNMQKYIEESEKKHIIKKEQKAKEKVNTFLNLKNQISLDLLNEVRNHKHLLNRKLCSSELKPIQLSRLHLALLSHNDIETEHLEYLSELNYLVDPDELLLIRSEIKDVLRDQFDTLTNKFWVVLENTREDSKKRIRAACMLASFDQINTKWKGVAPFLVSQLMKEPPSDLRKWTKAFFPISSFIWDDLRALTHDYAKRETVRAATFVLITFIEKDLDILAECITESTAAAYNMFFDHILKELNEKEIERLCSKLFEISTMQMTAEIHEIIKQQFDRWIYEEDSNENPKSLREKKLIHLGKKRADAIISLIKLNNIEKAVEALDSYGMPNKVVDPECLTQFAARVIQREIQPISLLNCLSTTKNEVTRFILLMTLGEYKLDDIPQFQNRSITDWVVELFISHESSAIHGVCEWLLRIWDKQGPLLSTEALQHTISQQQEWFTISIKNSHMTMVVYPPGEFKMGSPEDEWWRGPDEEQHNVKINHSFALSSHIVTRQLFEYYLEDTNQSKDEFLHPEQLGHDTQIYEDQALSGITWNKAIEFCRWLTIMAGMGEEDQCCEPLSFENIGYSFNPCRKGFRLPTEAEHEYAIRCGTETAFSFGSDRKMLNRYGWYMNNAARAPKQTGLLRPDLRGLFDGHGNVFEWCQDWYDEYKNEFQENPIGPDQPGKNNSKVLRGGGWYNHATDCRSSARNRYPTEKFFLLIGFRVAATLSE